MLHVVFHFDCVSYMLHTQQRQEEVLLAGAGQGLGRGGEGRPMIGSAQAIAHRARMQTDLGWHHRSGPGCWVGSASEHFVRQTVGCNFVRQATATATA